MRRKGVSRRQGAATEVRASVQAHRGRVGPKLNRRLPPPDGEATFTYQVYFDHMDGELARVQQRLIVAEDAHQRKLAEGVQLRRESAELTSTVYDKQTAARQVLGGYHGGDRGFEVARVSGPTPQESKPLAEQVDQTAKALRNPPGLLVGRIAGVEIDPEAMADDLESELGALQAVREVYQRTRKETDGTRQTLNAAIAEFDGVFPWVSRSLEALFLLVGERELSERIRTSRRRAARRGRDGEEEDGSGEASSDDGSVTEGSASPPAESAEAAPSAA